MPKCLKIAFTCHRRTSSFGSCHAFCPVSATLVTQSLSDSPKKSVPCVIGSDDSPCSAAGADLPHKPRNLGRHDKKAGRCSLHRSSLLLLLLLPLPRLLLRLLAAVASAPTASLFVNAQSFRMLHSHTALGLEARRHLHAACGIKLLEARRSVNAGQCVPESYRPLVPPKLAASTCMSRCWRMSVIF